MPDPLEQLMKTNSMYLGLLGLAFVLGLATGPAHAQATRTWVSGVGDDANPCSRTAPCKTFAGAISKTATGGEIDALDPSGFGALTITKAITIDGGGGQIASVLVEGTNAIVVAAQPGDVVILRNLQLNGLQASGVPGINGIRFLSGSVLSVENCAIFGFGSSGIDVATTASATLNVLRSTITNNFNGIVLEPGGGTLIGEMDHTTIQKATSNAITTNGGSVNFTVTNSNLLNAAGTGVNAGGGGTVLSVDSSSVSSNNTGFATAGGIIRVSRNVIYDNNNNNFSIAGGTIASSGDNIVAVNGATVPNGTVTKQ
jgi:hypothetical protein